MKDFFNRNKILIAIFIGAIIIASIIYLLELNTDCLIKGNINNDEKIYHMPDGQFYNRTIIDTSKGEKWFCSEIEAQTAGWRKSLK